MGTLTVITGPTVEPVTAAEFKDFARIDSTSEDSLINGFIQSAREFTEKYLNLRLVEQVVELSMDGWTASEFSLGVWPIISLDSIKYDDTSSPSVEQTLVQDTDYYADIVTDFGRVKAISAWPSVAVKPNPIRIRMTVGHAATPESPQDLANNIPQGIKNGLMAYAAYLYDGDPEMEKAAMRTLWPSRRL